jgi:8-oxo-dGTP diphosphatase
VREKQMASAELLPFAQAVVARCRRAGALVVVNGDIALATCSAADGVHLPAAQLLAAKARPAVEWCGASCHDARELQHAVRLALDYVLLGPVLPTLSHPGAPTLGWERFTRLIERYPLPVLAVGGMGPAQLQTAWRAGAHGVAMLRGAWGRFRNGS